MRISFIVGAFPTISETFIVNQIISLIDEGHEVKIYSFERGPSDIIHKSILEYNLLNEVTYSIPLPKKRKKKVHHFFCWFFTNIFQLDWLLVFKSLNFFKFGRKALNLKLFYESQFFLMKKKFDVIHVHFGVNAGPIAALKSKGFLKKSKLVVSFHGFDLMPNKEKYYRRYYSNLLEHCDNFTVNTKYLQNNLIKIFPKIKNVSLLPVGLDTSYFSKYSTSSKDKFKIVYCGRLTPLKGADIAVDIAMELILRGFTIELNIIGEGGFRNVIEKKIIKLAIEKSVFLKGALSQDMIREFMNVSNVFLLPGTTDPDNGRAEAQGLVIQEAQAMELPVVVSDVGGMKYGLLHNETGFVVKEKDIKGFADAIQKLIENPKLAKEMGRKGRIFVKENYDSKVLVKQLLAIYNK